jgi:hypothetical protein
MKIFLNSGLSAVLTTRNQSMRAEKAYFATKLNNQFT